MKATIGVLSQKGLRGRALIAEFVHLIPHWQTYFANPISENAIAQRADKMWRYDNENPRTNERTRVYWRRAVRVVRLNVPLGKRAVAELIAE
jgi:hypothetical protein